MGCFVCVPQDKIYIVETCGEFSKEAHPGCHCLKIPGVYAVAGKVTSRITPLIVDVESKTKDDVFVTLVIAVQHRVKTGRVYEAFYTLANPTQQIRSYVYDVVRATVPKLTLDEVFESKQDIARSILQDLRQEMECYGFEILDALVVDVNPDAKVRASMNEINASKRLREAALYKSEAAKIHIVTAAEAEAESQYLQGVGVARQRKAIVDGLKTAVDQFQGATGVDGKAATDIILVTQYFDTIKDIAKQSNSNTVFYLEENGPDAALLNAVRQGMLQANAEHVV